MHTLLVLQSLAESVRFRFLAACCVIRGVKHSSRPARRVAVLPFLRLNHIGDLRFLWEFSHRHQAPRFSQPL